MAVDYLSALNVGSGLNVTQIVDALVDAQKAPREEQLTSKIEQKTVSISAFAEIKNEFDGFKSGLNTLSYFSGLVVNTTGPSGASSAIGATVTDPSLVSAFDHNIVVSSLAQPQTISFEGYNNQSATIDATNLTIDLGSWGTDSNGSPLFTANTDLSAQSIALDSSDTISSVRDKINQLNIGVNATIVRIAENNYSLAVTSAFGSQNQIRIQATSSTDNVSNLSYDPGTNSADSAKQVAAATDASFTFNGLDITRSSNTINDLIAGVTLNLKAVSSDNQKITASFDSDLSFEAMQIFVDELNSIMTNLNDAGKSSLDQDESGPLAGDTLLRTYRNRLRMITTTPITGFGPDDIYLSNFGVMTNRDGTLSLDETKFKGYFSSNPEEFSALTSNKVNTSNLAINATMLGSAWTPGAYQFQSVVRSATTVLSANESTALSFKAVDSGLGIGDGQLSDNLQSYVAINPSGQWSVTGTDSSLLSIDGSGVVTVSGGTDFEAKTSYSFNVEYTVSADEKFTEAVTLNIGNLAERKYTLTGANVPTVVAAGDSFSISVDGQTITTAGIEVGGDNNFTMSKLVTALNLANTAADGVFTEESSNLVFTYNDAATVQTSALTSGLIYNPAAAIGTVSELTPGAVTARTIDFAHKDVTSPIISNAVTSDVFKIDISYGGNSYVVSHTIDDDDVSAIFAMATASEKAAYLAGKLDEAAGSAASGLDVGIDFAQSGGNLVGTATIAGTDYNAATISQLQFGSGGSNFSNLGSANDDVAGTSTAEVVKIAAPSLPDISDGDKFRITLDNNGSNLTITSVALSAGADLTAISNALNSAHAGVNGNFTVSGSDLHFTYNHNTGNISNTNDTGLTYIPAAGTISQSAAGVDHGPQSIVNEVSHVAGTPSATLDGVAMTLENGLFKTTSGGARGVQISAVGNQSGTIYVGKSLFGTLNDFSDSVLQTNGEIDKKVERYNGEITDYNKQLTELETRMENERARYIEQFTAMESAVSSFKETGKLIDNMMESWKAGLS